MGWGRFVDESWDCVCGEYCNMPVKIDQMRMELDYAIPDEPFDWMSAFKRGGV
jgi:hypothetical protein